MPAGEYHSPREVLDHIYALVDQHKADLGVGYIGYADENLLPEYPAVVVSAGNRQRDLAGTHTFSLHWTVDIWVHHAKLSISHKTRSREDMDMAQAIIDLLDAHCKLATETHPEGNIIFGYVDSETPGVVARRNNTGKNEAVVSTRLTWIGEGRQRFV